VIPNHGSYIVTHWGGTASNVMKLQTPPKSPENQMPSHMMFAPGLHFLLVQKISDITFLAY
jgi:hypothetical protein